MKRTRIHRARRLRGTLIALTAASGLLLTGCSGDAGDSGQSSKADSRQNSGGGSGYAPAPAQSNGSGEQQDGRTDSEGEQGDTEGDFAPPPTTSPPSPSTSTPPRTATPAAPSPTDTSPTRPRSGPRSSSTASARTTNAPTATASRSPSTAPAPTARTGPWSAWASPPAPPSRTANARSAALTFVIDISGSMAEPGRLDLAKDSLGVMTDRLRDDDSVAIVTFSDEAETVLPMTRLDDHRDRVHDAIDELEPTDSTNLGAGVRTGYATAVKGLREGATNRVVLVSDALANTGDTEADSILDRISDARREHGITLFGVGVGSDYGDALMEQLADKGDGNTTYVSNESDARKVFCEQLPRNVDLTARDAKAQVAFDPETVAEFRLIGYDNRRVADDDFRDDRVDGERWAPATRSPLSTRSAPSSPPRAIWPRPRSAGSTPRPANPTRNRASWSRAR